MPNWDKILELVQLQNSYDTLRKQYIKKIEKHTHRNVIVYYSGWLQKTDIAGDFAISDNDKNGFMICMYKDENLSDKGLDLILHTPGGDVGATESLIDYLRSIYGTNIRTIIPQIAMSGGTLMAISAKEIVMGSHSSLGPVDPNFGGMPAQSYLEEFNKACLDVQKNPQNVSVWQVILNKINPGFLTLCQHAVEWSADILAASLKFNMLSCYQSDDDFNKAFEPIKKLFVDQTQTKNHARHINRDRAKLAGLNISNLEDDKKLEDLILALHYLLCITFQQTDTAKIICSGASNGMAYITHAKPIK